MHFAKDDYQKAVQTIIPSDGMNFSTNSILLKHNLEFHQ